MAEGPSGKWEGLLPSGPGGSALPPPSPRESRAARVVVWGDPGWDEVAPLSDVLGPLFYFPAPAQDWG